MEVRIREIKKRTWKNQRQRWRETNGRHKVIKSKTNGDKKMDRERERERERERAN